MLYLSQLVQDSNANIIKLPNISASLPQLIEAVKELNNKGYGVPPYIKFPKTIWEYYIKCRYEKIQGSVVNPILRTGNSNRYIPFSVKKYAKKYPTNMKEWSNTSQTRVISMNKDDFYHTEQSMLIDHNIIDNNEIKIVLITNNGKKKILRKKILLKDLDIIDAAVMRKKSLLKFINQEIKYAKDKNILFSVHLKSSMMKISDPIIFGTIVKEFYKKLIQKYYDHIKILKINFNNGMNEFYQKIESLPQNIKKCILQDLDIINIEQPKLAMVDFVNKISNLHIPNGVIIDSSIPIMIKNAGQMRGLDGKFYDTNAIIPDSSYSAIYKIMIEDLKKYGVFDPSIIGSVTNIGLMAESAEEYGSNDTTFQIPDDGYAIQVCDRYDTVLIEHKVSSGDIWRLCHTSHQAIQNWIKLGLNQINRQPNIPVIFWLDSKRTHDTYLIKKLQLYIKDVKNVTSNFKILSPIDAMSYSIACIRLGKDIVSVTGNVLRDYLTDLFPILELGTSANMLSIINLTCGGVLFETGSGGSAPKHMKKFIKTNHLCWSSLGEFLALSSSLEHVAHFNKDITVAILLHTLNQAIEDILKYNHLPSNKIGELDSRGSHFYLARYWSEYLATQTQNKILRKKFQRLAGLLIDNEKKIIFELANVQGSNVDIGGYYYLDTKKTNEVMRPSTTLNSILTK